MRHPYLPELSLAAEAATSRATPATHAKSSTTAPIAAPKPIHDARAESMNGKALAKAAALPSHESRPECKPNARKSAEPPRGTNKPANCSKSMQRKRG